jgi:indole-3-glycerol phosphate synthase
VWNPPSGTLGELVSAAYESARLLPDILVGGSWGPKDYFETSLRGGTVAVIAEVKRKSPSKGAINPGMNCSLQAEAYRSGGASAISVLTEPTRFGGSLEDMAAVREVTELPILAKDFHVSEVQLLHAMAAGANAALIIVRAVEPARILALAEVARLIGLETLFEIRDENELEIALTAGAKIIGVNNRNLETLVIDESTVDRILPLIPAGIVAVAESGYTTRESVERAAAAGADAVLIGSSLSSSIDPAATLKGLLGIPKASRD